MTTRARRSGVLAALAFVLVLAGCGGDDTTISDPGGDPITSAATPSADESPTSSPSESATLKEPQCSQTWVAGEKLRRGYQNCYEGDQRVKADGRYCEFGKSLMTYDNRFWAVPGGPIQEADGKLLDDADYRDALAKCSG